MEERVYKITGRKEDLDNLEKTLRHIEYLGVIGASRNIMIQVDGDGSGKIKVYKNDKRIDNEHYNINQGNLVNGCVGVYDIG